MTTGSLFNTTSKGGLFHELLSAASVIISDEASPIPEPAFVAIAARFSQARHILICDLNQLDPHIRFSHSSQPALLTARLILDVLSRRNVPSVPLITTFRAHHALIELPNKLPYDGTLVRRTHAWEHRLMTRRLRIPNPAIPLLIVDIKGASQPSPSVSHWNEDWSRWCKEIVVNC
ncbi:unnamed protein product [Heligmosomoides polygyrus]|uniref:AAA_12 domain-containing protein n=1 Tax=Heligmosomoides polygyrus TaxID=6339 RepID=A0A183G372_HELPZ|nr:unnamed protein product [Heligmosomoides polygyrus]